MHHLGIDRLSCLDTPAHRLDARSKLIAVIIFTVAAISVPPTSIAIIVCYAAGPFIALSIGRIPIKFVAKQILFVSPFVLVLALTCIFFDSRPPVEMAFGPWRFTVAHGWLVCLSILAKFIVTMSALMFLITTTRFGDLLRAFAKLGVPGLLVMQLAFLYRYIFLLIEKAQHILRARKARTLRNLGARTELKTAAAMVGTLFVSSIDTAARVNTAMQVRGFTGKFKTLTQTNFTRRDWFFVTACVVYLLILYFLQRVV